MSDGCPWLCLVLDIIFIVKWIGCLDNNRKCIWCRISVAFYLWPETHTNFLMWVVIYICYFFVTPSSSLFSSFSISSFNFHAHFRWSVPLCILYYVYQTICIFTDQVLSGLAHNYFFGILYLICKPDQPNSNFYICNHWDRKLNAPLAKIFVDSDTFPLVW